MSFDVMCPNCGEGQTLTMPHERSREKGHVCSMCGHPLDGATVRNLRAAGLPSPLEQLNPYGHEPEDVATIRVSLLQPVQKRR